MSVAPSILIIIPWFGPWPAWMRFFLASCRANPTVDWVLIGDAGEPADRPANVRYVETSFADYRALIAARLRVRPRWDQAYKLCDFKPTWGVVHADLAAGYDYWGFGDLDVIYGDIRAIYTPAVLSHDLISTHAHVVAGHLCLVRNTLLMNHAFKRHWGWRRVLADPRHRSFDEQYMSRLFPGVLRAHWRHRLHWPLRARGLFVERFSTAIAPLAWVDGTLDHPKQWFWRDGRLTNDRTGERQFLYLHVSHWQSNRWTSEPVAPWSTLDTIDRAPQGALTGFTISREGFTPLLVDA